MPKTHVVTGAAGYTGKYIARLLLERGDEIRSLTGHPERPNPFDRPIETAPLAFDYPDALAKSLEGADTLFNTYWIRIARGDMTHERAADNLRALFAAAKAQGVRRMIATHPGGAASIDERRRMIALGAYAEYAFLACMPARGETTPAELAATLRALGVGNCIVTTALGQWMNPPPAEGMRMAIAALLDAGMSADEVSTLVKRNPAELLGVE